MLGRGVAAGGLPARGVEIELEPWLPQLCKHWMAVWAGAKRPPPMAVPITMNLFAHDFRLWAKIGDGALFDLRVISEERRVTQRRRRSIRVPFDLPPKVWAFTASAASSRAVLGTVNHRVTLKGLSRFVYLPCP